MICGRCQAGNHVACRELARQQSALGDIILAGSQWCDCQHYLRGGVKQNEEVHDSPRS